MVKEFDPKGLEEALKDESPLIVDFWASWCGPCKQLGPVFEAVSKQLDGKCRFAKISVEDNTGVGEEHGVMSIPCMILFKGGKEVDRIVGFLPEDALKEKIEKILG